MKNERSKLRTVIALEITKPSNATLSLPLSRFKSYNS